MKLHTIIISDLHLGTQEAHSDQLLDFLEKNPCENLIINGDLVDGLYLKIFGNRKNKFDHFFEKLEKIRKENQTKLLYIRGNHEVFIERIQALKHFKIIDDMMYPSGGKKYYICHGHQFDFANRKLGMLAFIAFFVGSFAHVINRAYNKIRKRLGMKELSLIKPIKRLAKILIGGKTNIDTKIYQKAKEQKADGIICGHFHKTENRRLGEIRYLNSGDWIETRSALIEDQQGNREVVHPR